MELKNTVTKLKNTLERFNKRLDEAKKDSVNSKTGQRNLHNKRSKKKKEF